MSLAQIKSHLWSNKRQINRPLFYAASLFIAATLAFSRIRPLLEGKKIIIVFSREKSGSVTPKGTQGPDNHHAQDKTGTSNSINQRQLQLKATGHMQYLIERPLFDGQVVKLQGVLLQGISSNQPQSAVEVEIIGGDLSGTLDQDMLHRARLVGSASPSLDTKRYAIQFSQLIFENGKRYSVVGYAYEEGARLPGLPADYSSGLTSRLAGAALGRTIQVGEDLLSTQALKSTGNEGIASDEINRNLFETGQQAGSSISQEASKDLVSTKPELFLKAGTTFWLKLQATSPSQGDTHE